MLFISFQSSLTPLSCSSPTLNSPLYSLLWGVEGLLTEGTIYSFINWIMSLNHRLSLPLIFVFLAQHTPSCKKACICIKNKPPNTPRMNLQSWGRGSCLSKKAEKHAREEAHEILKRGIMISCSKHAPRGRGLFIKESRNYSQDMKTHETSNGDIVIYRCKHVPRGGVSLSK